jgi:hypothetical protein
MLGLGIGLNKILDAFLLQNSLDLKVGNGIDYRCENRKKVGELRGDIGAIKKVLTPFRKQWSSAQEIEPFSPEMHLTIPLLSRGLILSISKPGCRVSALHFFVK